MPPKSSVPLAVELWRGRHLRVLRAGNWEYVQRHRVSGIVAIIAVTPASELLLVEQYRPPLGRAVLEIPAGLAGDTTEAAGESLEQAARRELLEETGWQAGTLHRIFEGAVSAGLSDEMVTFFLARDLEFVGPATGDGHEQITVHAIPSEGIHDWLDSQRSLGKVVDCKVHTALELYRHGLAVSE